MGKNAVRFGDTYAAITYFENYLKEKPNRYDLKLELADLYRKARDYSKAESMYKEVYINEALKFPDAQFYYAKMLKANGKYEEAKQEYTKFSNNKAAKTLENIKQLKKLAASEIKGCDAAIEYSTGKYSTLVHHLDKSINKAHIELSPILIDSNTLLYASINEDKLKLYDLDKNDKLPTRKFYIAEKDSGKWKGGKLFDAPFNDPEANVGNGTFSFDGTRFYYSKCAPNGKGKTVCRLMVSTKVKNKWQNPIDLGNLVNSEEFTSTMPTVGIDSKKNRRISLFCK